MTLKLYCMKCSERKFSQCTLPFRNTSYPCLIINNNIHLINNNNNNNNNNHNNRSYNQQLSKKD